jgi:hypothetical protein
MYGFAAQGSALGVDAGAGMGNASDELDCPFDAAAEVAAADGVLVGAAVALVVGFDGVGGAAAAGEKPATAMAAAPTSAAVRPALVRRRG